MLHRMKLWLLVCALGLSLLISAGMVYSQPAEAASFRRGRRALTPPSARALRSRGRATGLSGLLGVNKRSDAAPASRPWGRPTRPWASPLTPW